MASGAGIEPTFAESESAVLPELDDPEINFVWLQGLASNQRYEGQNLASYRN